MNFKLQRRTLLFGTVITLVLTSAVFTYFIHRNNEETKIQFFENKLKGDAQSILPHLYQSGNFAWFNANLEQFKKLGLPCLNVKDASGSIIWGTSKDCSSHIEAKNYVDQKIFDISYDLPQVTILSTIETNGSSFAVFFFIQIIFLSLAYQLLSAINRRHAETMVQIEHINGLNESNERVLKLTRTLGHNLKSPLAALKTLHNLTSHKLNSDEKDLLQSIYSNIDSMTERLIEQKIETVPTSIVDVKKVVSSIVDIKLLEFSKNSLVEIEKYLEPSLYSLINQNELSTIISNLINNSVEARPLNQKIKIIVSSSCVENSIYLRVRDNGIGIASEQLSQIFTYGMSTKTKGKGCGLHHAKETIDTWGGQISVSSEIGLFTEVCIELPLLTKQKEIILIDDESLNVLSWKGMAKKNSVQFRGYTDPEDFFNNIPENKSSLIYVDYDLNGTNGIEIISKILHLGFKNVYLATGHSELLQHGITQVGKEFPIQNIQ